MNSIIQIKCPFDGAVLSILKQPGLEKRNVTCPICKHTYPFSQFKRVVQKQNNAFDDPGTDYNEKTRTGNFKSNVFESVGCLMIKGTNQTFPLKLGYNTIGRKASNSSANFVIDTGMNRLMSREHILVEVKEIPGKGVVHYLSLCKEKVNATFVGNERIYPGDSIVLKQFDEIRLPGADLIFFVPDPEGTDI